MGDLKGVTTDVLAKVPEDHTDQSYLGDMCRAVLVAGLYPNLAWIKRRGKGNTLQGLGVTTHPGSVNSKENECVMAFYDIQETTDRWLYDTTVVTMAPLLLFAPELDEIYRGHRVVFRISSWEVAVEPSVADDILALRQLLRRVVDCSVGCTPTKVHMAATDALVCLFSDKAALEGVAEEEWEVVDAADQEATSPQDEVVIEEVSEPEEPIDVGSLVEAFWPEDDQWLLATVVRRLPGGSFRIRWDEDGSTSDVPLDYVRRRRIDIGALTTSKRAAQNLVSLAPKRPNRNDT